MMSDRVAEIRERLQAVTPGPWRSTVPPHDPQVRAHGSGLPIQVATTHNHRDSEFLANSREDIEWLLAENERLAARVKELEGEWELCQDGFFQLGFSEGKKEASDHRKKDPLSKTR